MSVDPHGDPDHMNSFDYMCRAEWIQHLSDEYWGYTFHGRPRMPPEEALEELDATNTITPTEHRPPPFNDNPMQPRRVHSTMPHQRPRSRSSNHVTVRPKHKGASNSREKRTTSDVRGRTNSDPEKHVHVPWRGLELRLQRLIMTYPLDEPLTSAQIRTNKAFNLFMRKAGYIDISRSMIFGAMEELRDVELLEDVDTGNKRTGGWSVLTMRKKSWDDVKRCPAAVAHAEILRLTQCHFDR